MSAPDGTPTNSPTGQAESHRYLKAFHRALRAVRLYPAENTMVKQALTTLHEATAALLSATGHCDLHCIGDYVFVNGIRLRVQLDTYAALSHVVGRYRHAGIGGILVLTAPDSEAWVTMMTALLAPAPALAPDDRREQVISALTKRNIAHFAIEPAVEEGAEAIEETQQERTRQTFMHSLTATRQLMQDVRVGRTPALRQAKRAVQGIVDLIMTDDTSLLGMTTLRDFDEYTFVHSVNVCILAVALGRRIGLNKLQLLDLGLAALMHDIGKSRVPLEVLNKRGKLEEHEYQALKEHTWRGVLAMFALGGATSQAWRAMTVAYEHHMGIELTGYPHVVNARELSLFSRIVSIVDGYDAATSTRVYQPTPWSPADVVRGMRDNPRLGLDPVLVRAFSGLMGIYPIGTVVLLDTQEVALVAAAPREGAPQSRPRVRLLFDSRGNPSFETELRDLTDQHASGEYVRTVVRTEDAERYGIRVSDYLT